MTRSLPPGLTDTFLWSEDLGYGWHSREPMSYEGDYFAKYQVLDATPMGAALTAARVELVRKYCDPTTVLDIGIGGGRFVQESGGYGYDVSREAVKWLSEQKCFEDPYVSPVTAITCWDSLEHIPEPEKLIERVQDWVFLSIPIYDDVYHVLRSKHYKPGEHIWYHTLDGLIDWFDGMGFEVQEINSAEVELGREGIMSFVFRRYR